MTTYHYTVNMPAHPSVIFAVNSILDNMPLAPVDFTMGVMDTGRIGLSFVVCSRWSGADEVDTAREMIAAIGAIATRIGGTFAALSAEPPLAPA